MVCRQVPSRAIFTLLACTAACGLVGCSRRSGLPETAPVHGQVIYKDRAVAGAHVSLIGEHAPRFAVGTTDEAGKFELTTFEPGDGAVLGAHTVTVSKPAVEIETTSVDPTLDRDAYLAVLERAAERAIKAQAAGSLLPAKYADQKTSDLRVEVVRGGNDFTIELID